ncbi:MAG: hypothetical protein ABEJ24_05995 [Candidatus Magasanikbacteria bacterium]
MREKLVSARMNALWFSYVSIFLFSLLPNWGIYLGFVEIIGISAGLTVLLNLWNCYRDKDLFDERKIDVATNGMAWAFVVLSFGLITSVTLEHKVTKIGIRETASMGLWIWLMYFFIENLRQKYWGDFW